MQKFNKKYILAMAALAMAMAACEKTPTPEPIDNVKVKRAAYHTAVNNAKFKPEDISATFNADFTILEREQGKANNTTDSVDYTNKLADKYIAGSPNHANIPNIKLMKQAGLDYLAEAEATNKR